MKQKLTLEETIQALNMTMPAQTGDKVIAYAQSVSYLERLQAAAVPCELVTMEGANHMEPRLFNSPEYTEEIINFLKTFMNPLLYV